MLCRNITINKIYIELKVSNNIIFCKDKIKNFLSNSLDVKFKNDNFIDSNEYRSVLNENTNLSNLFSANSIRGNTNFIYNTNYSRDYFDNFFNYSKDFKSKQTKQKEGKKRNKKENNIKFIVRRLDNQTNNEIISQQNDDNYFNESKNEYSIYSLKSKNMGNFNKFDIAKKDKQSQHSPKKLIKDIHDKKHSHFSKNVLENIDNFSQTKEININISKQIQNNYIINNVSNQMFCQNSHYINNSNSITGNYYQNQSNNYSENNKFFSNEIFNQMRKNQNLCNVDIFMTNSTPLYIDSHKTSVKEILFSFSKSSILGLDCILKLSGASILTNYCPYLSSLKIELINPYNKNFCHSSGGKEGNFYDQYNKRTLINFHEEQNIQNRLDMIQKLEELFEFLPELENLSLSEINEVSYFSLLWTPIKSNRGFQNSTSFLVFYRFRERTLTNSLRALSVIGMVSNMTDEEFWLKNQLITCDKSKMNEYVCNELIKNFHENKYKYIQIKVMLII